MRGVIALVAIAVLALAGSLSAAQGGVPTPPGDQILGWSPDGSTIAFITFPAANCCTPGFPIGFVSPGGQNRVVVNGAATDSLDGIVFSPDSSEIAYVGFDSATGHDLIEVAQADGTAEGNPLAEGFQPLQWQHGTILFRNRSGIASIRPDGTQFQQYPQTVQGAPSPDGSRFAYVASDGHVHVIAADGTGDLDISPKRALHTESLAWSPDGSRLAYGMVEDGSSVIVRVVVARLFGGNRVYQLPHSRQIGGGFAWSPAGDAIVYGTPSLTSVPKIGGIALLSLATGATKHIASFGESPVYSPDGRWIAFSGGGPCRDRLGIYVMKADGSRLRRLTRDCRILGTDGNDTLHGTELSDVILGLRGDDRLYASDQYLGDTLKGGPGADLLVGGGGRDTLEGGPGNDRLFGGRLGDVLSGGTGRDLIDGGTGNDRIYADDGQRDTIVCGTNGPLSGNRDHDVVYADRFDVVAKDCEVVHRI